MGAKQLVREGSVANYYRQLDLAAFSKKLEVYAAIVAEFETYVGSHAKEAKKVSALHWLMGESTKFLKAAKELMRRKRDSKPYSAGARAIIGANSARSVPGIRLS